VPRARLPAAGGEQSRRHANQVSPRKQRRGKAVFFHNDDTVFFHQEFEFVQGLSSPNLECQIYYSDTVAFRLYFGNNYPTVD
jgi:hypothetical protein